MTVTTLLAELLRRGVHLRVAQDQVSIRAPQGALTATHRSLLTQHKASICALLRERLGESVALSPLSHGQKALWFLYQLAPQSAAYNIMHAVRLCPTVDLQALHRALQGLMARHPCLRTTYITIDGEPAQRVHESLLMHLEVIEATAWSWQDLHAHMDREADRPFDLERGPVLRVTLYTRADQEPLLLLSVHHIVFDFISLTLFLNELCGLYAVETGQTEVSLPPLIRQYADYVRWQADLLASPKGEQLWAYWQKQLAGELPALHLPTDRPRLAVQTYEGVSHTLALSESLSQKLKELARAEGVTLYTLLLAAFQVLLHRYTAQEDILVGSPLAGRSRAEFAGIIGYFVNPVVLRADLSGNPPFKTFLRQVRHTVLAALEHGDYPFALVVERLQPARTPDRSPLFQVAFVLDKPPTLPGGSETPRLANEEGVAHGLVLGTITGGQRGADFDLDLRILEDERAFSTTWRYNTDLFDSATIARMAEHFLVLLEGIVTHPDRQLSELPLLTETERYQLLTEWNATQADYPQEMCMHQLFEAQAEQTPEATAVVFEAASLTYRELDQRANQLAHHLQTLGVGPDVLVGICMERSLEMVIGLLGILKAGGAYVPLDPEYPKERLAFMITDAAVSVLVTQDRLVAHLPTHAAQVVCLQSTWEELAHYPVVSAGRAVTSTHLAYVLYTSGSTGQPKGVQIPHRALVNFLQTMRQQPGCTAHDTLLAVTTLSFDIAALEIFLPLIVGGRLVVASREVATDGVQLSTYLAHTGATVMQATPATWQLLLAAGWQGSKALTVLCGGEALPPALAAQLLERSATVWNLYGPTEATIWATAFQVDARQGTIPIGRPIANTQIYLLDAHLHPVPLGVLGELHIGGVCLARGYLHRPELTTSKFIPHPFSDEPGARLYKTGDLARYLPDGTLEYLGRMDQQIKLHGFRIELGEIESILQQHAAVRESVVVMREDCPGEKRLVAYVVPHQTLAPSVSAWRDFLKEKLPAYMLPTAFIMLDALPLLPNGKVNRQGLPAPDRSRPELEHSAVLPRNAIEEVIAGLSASVLGLDQVGIYDDFFELGGHSLLATQLTSRIQDAFHIDIPLRRFFEAPTVAGLAALLLHSPEQRVRVERRAQLLLKVAQLSDDQVQSMLNENSRTL